MILASRCRGPVRQRRRSSASQGRREGVEPLRQEATLPGEPLGGGLPRVLHARGDAVGVERGAVALDCSSPLGWSCSSAVVGRARGVVAEEAVGGVCQPSREIRASF